MALVKNLFFTFVIISLPHLFIEDLDNKFAFSFLAAVYSDESIPWNNHHDEEELILISEWMDEETEQRPKKIKKFKI